MMDERGLDVSVYTPETLAYPYSFSHPEEEVRKRTVDYFSMAMDDALLFGTNKVFLNSGCGLLDLPREESFARLVDTYKKIAAIAEQKGKMCIRDRPSSADGSASGPPIRPASPSWLWQSPTTWHSLSRYTALSCAWWPWPLY